MWWVPKRLQSMRHWSQDFQGILSPRTRLWKICSAMNILSRCGMFTFMNVGLRKKLLETMSLGRVQGSLVGRCWLPILGLSIRESKWFSHSQESQTQLALQWSPELISFGICYSFGYEERHPIFRGQSAGSSGDTSANIYGLESDLEQLCFLLWAIGLMIRTWMLDWCVLSSRTCRTTWRILGEDPFP